MSVKGNLNSLGGTDVSIAMVDGSPSVCVVS